MSKKRIFNEKEIIDKYLDGLSMKNLARFYKTNIRSINNILIKNNVKRTIKESCWISTEKNIKGTRHIASFLFRRWKKMLYLVI